MNKHTIIANTLGPYWKKYLEKNGFEKQKKEVEEFMAKLTYIKSLNWNTIYLFITDPYYLSHYISFHISRIKTLMSFWRFSEGLLAYEKAYKDQVVSLDEWNGFDNEYLEGTLNSKNEEVRFLIIAEVLKFI